MLRFHGFDDVITFAENFSTTMADFTLIVYDSIFNQPVQQDLCTDVQVCVE